MGISSAMGSQALVPSGFGFRNMIINGDMRVNQRNTAVTSIGYTTDRWLFENYAGVGVSVAQNTDAPEGFSHSLRATVTSGNPAFGFDLAYILQKIEGFNFAHCAFGTASAKMVTASFWVRSSVVGLHSVNLEEGIGSRVYVGTYNIFAANTWEKKIVTFPGETSYSSWRKDNGPGATLRFPIIVGEVYQGAPGVWNTGMYLGATSTVNDCATTGNIFAITGVQLEANYVATPFEHRPVGVELALCQRYYEKTYALATAPGTNTVTGVYIAGTTSDGIGQVWAPLKFLVPKRAAPTVAFWKLDGTANVWDAERSGSGTNATLSALYITEFGFSGYFAVAGWPAWANSRTFGHWVALSEL